MGEEIGNYPQERILHLYPDEQNQPDSIGEVDNYYRRVETYFGTRTLRGSAIGYAPDGRTMDCSCEMFLRKVFSQIRPCRAVEIGTLYGVTTALLAHYSHHVTTIDIAYQQQASYLQSYFGVEKKIRYVIVKNDNDKAELLKGIEFDFAFIDAKHTYEAVKFDFECVKKCGRVLFHDYGLTIHKGVTQFVDELPRREVFTSKPFAYWEAK